MLNLCIIEYLILKCSLVTLMPTPLPLLMTEMGVLPQAIYQSGRLKLSNRKFSVHSVNITESPPLLSVLIMHYVLPLTRCSPGILFAHNDFQPHFYNGLLMVSISSPSVYNNIIPRSVLGEHLKAFSHFLHLTHVLSEFLH